MFKPPLFFSPMIVAFIILGGLFSHIKLKIMLLTAPDKQLGELRFELLKINLDKARVLTMLILPIKVSFLFFQIFKIFSILRNFRRNQPWQL